MSRPRLRPQLVRFLDRRTSPERARLPRPLQAALDARWALETGSPLPPDANSPRAASLRFSAFQRDFAARVPDGFVSEAQPLVDAALSAELLGNVDAWIAAHPSHPLADLAALWKIRIHHFAAARDAAWAVYRTLESSPFGSIEAHSRSIESIHDFDLAARVCVTEEEARRCR